MSDDRRYRVVVNEEEQYSIWRADLKLPPGWHATGIEGAKQDCLSNIEEVWTDMRPAGLRRRMEAHARQSKIDEGILK